jgi:formamidopyrimidine-DNA glycosylase
MPELPEVEAAAVVARRALMGRTLAEVTTHHAAQRRALPAEHAARCAGRRVTRIERRGKSQLLHLDDGAVLLVHFRMNGDWERTRTGASYPKFTRVAFDTADGRRLALVDSRALCTVTWHAPGHPPKLSLGPEPDALTTDTLGALLAGKRIPIKQALLDQKVVAGVGNIYAGEALWRARLDPRTPSRDVTGKRLVALVKGIKDAITDGFARQGRYRDGSRAHPFKVYDREGLPCKRCRTPIERMTQGARSTYYCPTCQGIGKPKTVNR